MSKKYFHMLISSLLCSCVDLQYITTFCSGMCDMNFESSWSRVTGTGSRVRLRSSLGRLSLGRLSGTLVIIHVLTTG